MLGGEVTLGDDVELGDEVVAGVEVELTMCYRPRRCAWCWVSDMSKWKKR